MYPLRFGPIFEYRLWGGRRLSNLLREPLPGDGPIGEAWILSDRDDHMSHVTNGPFRGRSLGELRQEFPAELMGEQARPFPRFPLLLQVSRLPRNALGSGASHSSEYGPGSCGRDPPRPKHGLCLKQGQKAASTLA